MQTQFKRKVENALSTLRKHLDSEKNAPVLAEKVPHVYVDKFCLAEQLTNLAVASWLESLEKMGANQDAVRSLAAQAGRNKKRVTIKLTSTQKVEFVRKEQREVPSDTKVESNSTGIFGQTQTRVVHTVTDYYWNITHGYEIVLWAGASRTAPGSASVRIAHRSASAQIVTTNEKPPFGEQAVGQRDSGLPPPQEAECDLTWLFGCIHPSSAAAQGADAAAPLSLSIAIDRDHPGCVTPRRNPTVEAALGAMLEFHAWLGKLESIYTFAHRLTTVLDVSEPSKPLPPDPKRIATQSFLPVLPLRRGVCGGAAAPIDEALGVGEPRGKLRVGGGDRGLEEAALLGGAAREAGERRVRRLEQVARARVDDDRHVAPRRRALSQQRAHALRVRGRRVPRVVAANRQRHRHF